MVFGVSVLCGFGGEGDHGAVKGKINCKQHRTDTTTKRMRRVVTPENVEGFINNSTTIVIRYLRAGLARV